MPSTQKRASANRQASPASASFEAIYQKNRLPGPSAAASGGADRVRTDDLRLARAALSQLSYSPSLLSEADAHTAGGPR
jgi:hypothetical protein